MTIRIFVLFCFFAVTLPILAVNIELADGIDKVEEVGGEGIDKVKKAGNKSIRPLLDVKTLEFEKGDINWRRDWWKYMSLVLSVLIALCLLIYITQIVAKLLGFVICLGAGTTGAWLAGTVYLSSLDDYFPHSLTNAIPANWILYILGFLAGYAIGVFVFALLKKPVQKQSPAKKKG